MKFRFVNDRKDKQIPVDAGVASMWIKISTAFELKVKNMGKSWFVTWIMRERNANKLEGGQV